MSVPLAGLAATALRLGQPPAAGPGLPLVADVWTDGDLGFVLLLHRRGDGFLAEELYCSVRGEGGEWDRPDHLGGSVLGLEVTDPSAVADALAGVPMAVVTASESLVYTGRGEEAEPVRVWALLVGGDADAVEVERFAPGAPARSVRQAPGPLVLVVLLPGERARVRALRRGSPCPGEPLEFRGPQR
ncbi:hypothetical protein AB0K80_04365 [Streptomyces sp. NPDC052682]|uniref:hypothetical protein n=1 Tax=Streptomyces sp. NPDC052682 TaxID=3154954 RepID=UPI003427EE5E